MCDCIVLVNRGLAMDRPPVLGGSTRYPYTSDNPDREPWYVCASEEEEEEMIPSAC